MTKSNEKNIKEEKLEYYIAKERRERYINYFLIIFCIILLILSIVFLNKKRYSNNDKIAYTNTSKSSNNSIKFIYDNNEYDYPPSKEQYVINLVSCDNAKGKWDNKLWQLNLSNIVDKVNCTLSFKKKEDNIIAYVNTKKLLKKDTSFKKINNNIVDLNKNSDNKISNINSNITDDIKLSQNYNIMDIFINDKSISFNKDVFKYYLNVDDDVENIEINVLTEDNKTKKSGKKEYKLNYGINEIIIQTIAEDNIHKSEEYKIIINRIHNLNKITFNNYDNCSKDEDCDYQISIKPNEHIKLNPLFEPYDATYKDVYYELLSGSDAITLDSDGNIKANDVLYKDAYINVVSKNNPNVKTKIKVMVEITKISSNKYEVKRDNLNYIPNIDLKTNIEQFLNNLDNDNKYLHVYSNQEEITNYENFVGTTMQIKLENNNKVYDTLDIVVLGDVDGNGKCISSDYRLINKYLLNQIELTGSKFIAGDVNKDGIIDNLDYDMINKYVLKEIDTFIS